MEILYSFKTAELREDVLHALARMALADPPNPDEAICNNLPGWDPHPAICRMDRSAEHFSDLQGYFVASGGGIHPGYKGATIGAYDEADEAGRLWDQDTQYGRNRVACASDLYAWVRDHTDAP